MERQKLVERLIYQKYNYTVGGFENSFADGNLEEMPSREEMIKEVYNEVMCATYVEMKMGLYPITQDIRFLGKETIMDLIVTRFNKEGEY